MSEPGDWHTGNQAYLVAALAGIRADLEGYLGRSEASAAGQEQAPMASTAGTSALEQVVSAFGLSPFERDLLLLCAGVELDSQFAALCAEAEPNRHLPTFSLALGALHDGHWSALAPTAPLRYWRLLEMAAGGGLATCPLRIDERILHFLAGVSYPDERLHGVARRWRPASQLPPSHREAAARVAARWSDMSAPLPVLQLCSDEEDAIADVAAVGAALCGLELSVIRSADLPGQPGDRQSLLRIWEREAVLASSALLLTVDSSDSPEVQRAAASFVEAAGCPLMVGGREPLRVASRTLTRFDINRPGVDEQSELWKQALGPLGAQLDGHVDRLVNQFFLGAPAIRAAAALVRAGAEDPDTAAALLWQTCRTQARSRLEELAKRVESSAGWEDLVLPRTQKDVLEVVVSHVRQRVKVYDQWGFASKSSRGLGISVLFAGASGTGKTLAAEVMANELRLDLYRIDLSNVVNKYIGETEKNLRRVFDAAESAGAVLLFDEADALFGKRSEVKDSHDRYANIEVSYLLQRMESYRGLAILTTNMKNALDPAFTRRIRFVVQFPFPGAEQRAEIWRRVFPAATPTAGLEVERLALLNVAGGNIRNIALGAAFLAADEGKEVGMGHLLRSARAEYAKLDRPLTDAEVAGWVGR